MRKLTLALTVGFLAPTAVMALTAGREAAGRSGLEAVGAAIQQGQIAPGSIAGTEKGSGEKLILAKGDKSGTGPGHGGHKGQHKGERKGGQEHGGGQKKEK
jgi:hypothetical protein